MRSSASVDVVKTQKLQDGFATTGTTRTIFCQDRHFVETVLFCYLYLNTPTMRGIIGTSLLLLPLAVRGVIDATLRINLFSMRKTIRVIISTTFLFCHCSSMFCTPAHPKMRQPDSVEARAWVNPQGFGGPKGPIATGPP
jgi:hypothetical protein